MGWISTASHLYVKDGRLLLQLSKLQVSSVAPVTRQEVEPIDFRRAPQVMPVSQVHLDHIGLRETQRRREWDSPQQQLAVARWLHEDKAQVGSGGVGVGELQVVSGDGLSGAVQQA